jgi:hypothetical protein
MAAKVAARAVDELRFSAGKKALAWLEAERGLSPATVRACRLGFLARDLYFERAEWGLEPEVKEDGSFKKVWVPGGLTLPYLHFRLRVRRDSPPEGWARYVTVSGSASLPMTLGGFRGRPVVIVESDLDAALVWQEAADLCGVMSLGSASLKPDRWTNEALLGASRILIALDADEAGRKASDWWKATYPRATHLPLLRGKDPNEMRRAGIPIRTWIQAGLLRGERAADGRTDARAREETCLARAFPPG